jgi:hypothetical protein
MYLLIRPHDEKERRKYTISNIGLTLTTFQTKSIVAQYTIVGCWIANNNEILLIGKNGLENMGISHCSNALTFVILSTPLMHVYLSNGNH